MNTPLTLSVDVGGTKILAGIVNEQGKILSSAKTLTPVSRGKAAVLAAIDSAIRSQWRDDVTKIGIGMAGLVDHEKGIYVQGPNFPKTFRNVNIVAYFSKKYGVSVSLDNDVHCFAIAEAGWGAAKGSALVVGMTLGTGIGGALMMNGKIIRGRNNAAGEIGHMAIVDGGRKCSCGKSGHLEAYASGNALIRRYQLLSKRHLDAFAIEALAKKGDKNAKLAIEESGHALALGLSNIIHVFNPDIIVIGGGIAKLEALWPIMRRDLKNMVAFPSLATTKIVRSQLGSEAALIGAALLK